MLSCITSIYAVAYPEAQYISSNILYYIKNKNSGKCLTVAGNNDSNGADIVQANFTAEKGQQWKVVHLVNGIYKIVSEVDSKNRVLEVRYANNNNGTNVDIWADGNSTERRFRIIKNTVNIDFSLYYDDSLNRDNELDLKHNEVMNEEEKKNERDIKAYHIVAEHCGYEHNRNTLIDNIDDDVKMMNIMVELLNSNNLNKHEADVISLYIIRRIDLVDDINDKNNLSDAYLKYKEQNSWLKPKNALS